MGWGSNNVDSRKPVYRVVVDESLDQFNPAEYDLYVQTFDPNDRYYDNKPVDYVEWAQRKIRHAQSTGLIDRMWNAKSVATTYSRKVLKEGVNAWVEEGTISWSKV